MKIRIIMVIILSVGLCLMTNSPGNVMVVLAVFTNLPHYKGKRFCFTISIGLIVSMSLQPKELSFFLYLYVVIRVLIDNPYS